MRSLSCKTLCFVEFKVAVIATSCCPRERWIYNEFQWRDSSVCMHLFLFWNRQTTTTTHFRPQIVVATTVLFWSELNSSKQITEARDHNYARPSAIMLLRISMWLRRIERHYITTIVHTATIIRKIEFRCMSVKRERVLAFVPQHWFCFLVHEPWVYVFMCVTMWFSGVITYSNIDFPQSIGLVTTRFVGEVR